MKSKTTLIILFIASLIFNANAKDYTLQYNFKEGDSFIQETVANMKINQEVMGQSMEIGSMTKTQFSYKVINVQNDLITMEISYSAMEMEMDMMGQKMGFSSESSSGNPMFAEFETMFKALKDIPITMTITSKGDLKEIKGVDKLHEATMASISNSQNPMVGQLAQQFSEESMKNTFEQAMTSYYPENAVSVGESWGKAISMNQSGITMEATMNMTLLSVKDNFATLKVKTDIGTKGKVYTQEVNGITVNMTMDGVQDGTVIIDLNSGIAKKADFTQKFDVESEAMNMKMPQTIVGTVKITME